MTLLISHPSVVSVPHITRASMLTVTFLTVTLLAVTLLQPLAAPAMEISAQKLDDKRPTDDSLHWQDVTESIASGLANTNSCWADVNGDGWPDLCAGDLWINQAGERFEKSGQAFGNVVAADADNDGDIDLFSWSDRQFWLNDGRGQFVQGSLPELPRSVSRGAVWGDFNLDGYVDLYIGGYEDWDAGRTYPDMLLFNEHGTNFNLALNDDRYRARGVTACDVDEDGDLDVYVSNYRLHPNLLWINDGQGKFDELAEPWNAVATSEGFQGGHSIGAAWGDFDNDGRFDLFAGNFAHVDSRGDQPKSRFLRQIVRDGQRVLDDLGPCGVHYQESYATPAVADADNDGDVDLFFTTVYGTASFGRPNAPVLFVNQGAFEFSDETAKSGLFELPPTYQAAWADFDRDGRLDLVTGGKLYKNESRQRHWLELTLSSDEPSINRAAIGAQVRLQLGDRTLTRQVEAGTGEGNQNDLTLHFGLGDHAEPVDLTIVWPGGKSQSFSQVDIDHSYAIKFGREDIELRR